MVSSLRVDGAEDLARVAGAVQRVEPKLRKELLAGIRKAVKPSIVEVKAEALSTLPAEGGLNRFVATSKIGVRTRSSGRRAGIRVVATKGGHDLVGINDGMVRHPVFGNRKVWVSQRVDGGFYSEPLTEGAPRIQKEIKGTMDRILAQIKQESGT